MRTITVKKNDAGQRLDKFLSKAVKGLPMSLMYKYIRTKKIKVNRARTEQSYMLSEGDEIQLFIRDEFFESPEKDTGALSRIVPKLCIVYEDENIVLLNKRPGVLVHEDADAKDNTLVMHLQAYLAQKGEYDPEDEQSFAPAMCNRIDRNTGGIVIAAKTAEALRILNDKIKGHELKKKYLCAVLGKPEKDSDEVVRYLLKDEKKNKVTVYKKPHPGAKEAVTRYRVLTHQKGLSLVEVELLTGRTHQIRATFADLGHPLLGDGKYGVNQVNLKYGMTTQALYSYQLTFAFKTDAGVLNHLNGKTFTVEEVPFATEYFQ